MPRFEGNYLLMTHGMALMKIPFNAAQANQGYPLLMQPFMTATGIDADCLRGKVSDVVITFCNEIYQKCLILTQVCPRLIYSAI